MDHTTYNAPRGAKGSALVIGAIIIAVIAFGGVLLYSGVTDDDAMGDDAMTGSNDTAAMTDGTPSEGVMTDTTAADGVMVEGDAMSDGSAAGDPAPMLNAASDVDGMMEQAMGSYEAYAPEKLAMADTGNVVLFFHASWCPTCRAAEKSIEETGVPAGLTILKTNYDTELALRKKYGITTQHTFVQVDAQGTLLKKWVGSDTAAAIAAQVL